jgi:hypothetical protein
MKNAKYKMQNAKGHESVALCLELLVLPFFFSANCLLLTDNWQLTTGN